MPSTTRVYVTQDRLSVRVDCVLDPEMEDAAVAEILAQSESMGIEPGLDAGAVKSALLTAAARATHIAGLVLAKGQEPTPPVDGAIAWQRDFFTSMLVENPKTGRVDYRQHLDNGVVASGDVLVVVTPPKPGTPGVDVFGKSIQPARPFTPKIRAGTGVHFDESTNTFVASTVGRVRFAKNVVSVDQTYAIQGSVGLKTGHVNHPGSVDVTMDVEPDSILEAGGTVHVSGAIKESDVVAGGDVLVGHGIIGGGKTSVHAGGSIEAVFAERAVLDAGHDIRIRRELIQCTARAHGYVSIPEGQIIGGVVSAILGIEAGQVGSHGDVPTTLIVGVDVALQEHIAMLHADLSACQEQILQLNEKIAPFKSRESTLTPMLRGKMEELVGNLEKVEERRAEVSHELEQLLEESRERLKARIVIRTRVYPDTHLCIGHVKSIISAETQGPVVAKLNDDGELVVEPESKP